MSGENADTNVDVLEGRYRAKRSQATLNIELALVTSYASGGQGAQSSVGGSVGGSPIITETTGGGGGTTGGGGGCPEISQFVLIQGDQGVVSVQVAVVKVGWHLYNPISQDFEKVTRAEVFDSPLIEVTDGWITAVGSPSHPAIRSEDDAIGLALGKCKEGLAILGYAKDALKATAIKSLKELGDGKVVCLETEGPGHIYCAGSDPDEMLVWHNTKPIGGNES